MNNLDMILTHPDARDCDSSTKNVFRRYWDKIEKAEKAYAGAERKRGRIVQRFNEEVLPLEEARCSVNYQLTKKLVDFLDAKSLSRTDKVAVIEWASDQLDEFVNSPFRGSLDVEGLMKQLHHHGSALEDKPTDEQLEDLREDVLNMFADADAPFEESDIDDLLNASRDGSSAFFEELERKTREMHERFQEQLFDQEHDFSVREKPSEQDVSATSLAKIYKRLAQRLHPDRAKTEEERKKRHDLMLQLTEAKRNQDVFAMLSLVREYGDEDDAMFSDQQLNYLVSGLQHKLYEIRQKKRALKTEQSTEALIYAKFHSKTNREMDLKFEDYKAVLADKIEGVGHLLQELKTVKQLKQHLAEQRRNHPLFSMPFDNMFFGEME